MKIFQFILNYISDSSVMKFPLAEKRKEGFMENLKSIFHNGETLQEFYKKNAKKIEQRLNSIEKKVDTIVAAVHDSKAEISATIMESSEKQTDKVVATVNDSKVEISATMMESSERQIEILAELSTIKKQLNSQPQPAPEIDDSATGSRKEEIAQKENLEIELEKNCGSYCIFSICRQIFEDNIKSFKYAEVEDDQDENFQWKDLRYGLQHEIEEKLSYIRLEKGCLESGYVYSFELELIDGRIAKYNKLVAGSNFLGDSGYLNPTVNTASKIILCAYNDGKNSNVHSDVNEFPKKWKMEITKTIVNGANVPVQTIGEYKELCKDYYKNMILGNIFPPKYVYETTSIADLFKEVFESSKDLKIILGAQFIKQLELFGFHKKDFKKCGIEDFQSTNENSLFVTHFCHKLLMIICVCENIHDLKKHLTRCNSNLKAFLILHEKSIADSYASLCGVVACPSVTKSYLKGKKSFLYSDKDIDLFLTKEDMQNKKTLLEWFENVIQEISSLRKHCNGSTNNKAKEHFKEVYGDIAAETMATMSLTDIKLPRLSKNVESQIKSLLLNNEQQKAINTKRCILKGPYGSGKSVVLNEVAKRLSKSKEGPSSIYYVCLDPYSLLEVHLKEHLQCLKDARGEISTETQFYTAHEMERQMQDANIDRDDLPSTINHICNKEQKLTSFLFDEFNGESFTKEFADRLNDVIDKNRNLHHLLLAPQSVQIERELHHKGQQVSLKKYQFELSKLEIIELPKRMRMTGRINDLIEVAERCVERINTKYKIPESSNVNTTAATTANHGSLPPLQTSVHHINKDQEKKEDQMRNESFEHDVEKTENILFAKKGNGNVGIADALHNSSEELLDNEGHLDKGKYLDKDEVFADAQRRMPSRLIPSRLIKNKFKYQQGTIGHGVLGIKPNLIHLDDNFDINSSKSGKVLSFVLEEICLDFEKCTTIICNSKPEATLVCYALKCVGRKYCPYFPNLLNKMPPDYKEKLEIWETLDEEKAILVTDHRGFRGCEGERCITFVDQNNPYKSHVLVEILARAVGYIDVLALPIQITVESEKVVDEAKLTDVLKEWEEKGVVDVSRVVVTEETTGNLSKLKVIINEEEEESIDVSPEDEIKFMEIVEKFNKNEVPKKQINQLVNNMFSTAPDPVSNSLRYSIDEWEPFVRSGLSLKYTQVFEKIFKNAKHFEERFDISITIDNDTKHIFIKGENSNKLKFKLYIYEQTRKMGKKYALCMGLFNDSKIVLRKSPDYPGLCGMYTREYSNYVNNAPRLLDLLLKALKEAKAKSNSMCFVMLHGGKLYSKLNNGEYTMEEVFNLLHKDMVFKSFQKHDLNMDILEDLEHMRTVYRYDMTFYTSEPVIRCRCKIYLKQDDNGTKYVTCEEAGDGKPYLNGIQVGPVYIEIPKQIICRLDIVNPRNGMTSRVMVSVIQDDNEFKIHLQSHLDILKKFFNDIELKTDGSFGLNIPDMPEGYLPLYLRQSTKHYYRIPDERKMILITSIEKIIWDHHGSFHDSETMDIFFDNEDILDMLDHTDWTPEQVADNYHHVIEFGNRYIQRLSKAGSG